MAQSPVESPVVFWNRVASLGLTDLKDKFTSNGWTTFADFALACSDFSGRDTTLFTKEVIEPLIGEDKLRITKIPACMPRPMRPTRASSPSSMNLLPNVLFNFILSTVKPLLRPSAPV